jgi:hypothetical protein
MGLADTLIDNLFETDEEKAAAKVKIMAAEQAGKLQELQISMSAILAEANSKDPWTSRARPSMMYVMYILILAAIPMGAVFAWDPTIADQVASGFGKWLNAVPDGLWALFGAGYLGYSGARSYEKGKGVTK